MLFLLVMELMQKMFEIAATHGLLSPLAQRGTSQRVSMFVDDVTIFIKPHLTDLQTYASLLKLFGEGSRLRVNLAKSTTLPIWCSNMNM